MTLTCFFTEDLIDFDAVGSQIALAEWVLRTVMAYMKWLGDCESFQRWDGVDVIGIGTLRSDVD